MTALTLAALLATPTPPADWWATSTAYWATAAASVTAGWATALCAGAGTCEPTMEPTPTLRPSATPSPAPYTASGPTPTLAPRPTATWFAVTERPTTTPKAATPTPPRPTTGPRVARAWLPLLFVSRARSVRTMAAHAAGR